MTNHKTPKTELPNSISPDFLEGALEALSMVEEDFSFTLSLLTFSKMPAGKYYADDDNPKRPVYVLDVVDTCETTISCLTTTDYEDDDIGTTLHIHELGTGALGKDLTINNSHLLNGMDCEVMNDKGDVVDHIKYKNAADDDDIIIATPHRAPKSLIRNSDNCFYLSPEPASELKQRLADLRYDALQVMLGEMGEPEGCDPDLPKPGDKPGEPGM